jgi:hypothetical protein
MKKTNTSNPLKFFNDAKAARNKSFSKSLIKADNGRITGPMTQQEAAAETAATSYPGPYANSTPAWSSQDKANTAKAISELARPINILGSETEKMNNLNDEYNNGYAQPIQGRNQYISPGANQYKQYKKGGTHKMPNGKVMLNSKMKKGGVMKKIIKKK